MNEMEMQKCILCGYPFYARNRASCDYCRSREVQLYTAAKDYLVDHPLADYEELSREVGTPRNLIELWLEECRLELPELSPLTIPCKKCSKSIHYGKLCLTCRPPFVLLKEELEQKIRNSHGYYFSRTQKSKE